MSFDTEQSLIRQGFDRLQNGLSIGQAIPVIGLAVSPVKAFVSAIQVITGLGLSVLFGALSFGAHILNKPENASELFDFTVEQSTLALNGCIHLIYSVGNLLTLGCVGFIGRNFVSA